MLGADQQSSIPDTQLRAQKSELVRESELHHNLRGSFGGLYRVQLSQSYSGSFSVADSAVRAPARMPSMLKSLILPRPVLASCATGRPLQSPAGDLAGHGAGGGDPTTAGGAGSCPVCPGSVQLTEVDSGSQGGPVSSGPPYRVWHSS